MVRRFNTVHGIIGNLIQWAKCSTIRNLNKKEDPSVVLEIERDSLDEKKKKIRDIVQCEGESRETPPLNFRHLNLIPFSPKVEKCYEI